MWKQKIIELIHGQQRLNANSSWLCVIHKRKAISFAQRVAGCVEDLKFDN